MIPRHTNSPVPLPIPLTTLTDQPMVTVNPTVITVVPEPSVLVPLTFTPYVPAGVMFCGGG